MKKVTTIIGGIALIAVVGLLLKASLTTLNNNRAQVSSLLTDTQTLINQYNSLVSDVQNMGLGLIVDNSDTSVVRVGAWEKGTTVAGYWGPNYEILKASGASFTYIPNIPKTGQYEIFTRWTAGTNRSSAVPIDIISSSGQKVTKTVDQRGNNGTWVSLGMYSLTAGTGNRVVIRTASGYVVADAVRFVLQPGALTPIATTTPPVTVDPTPTPTPITYATVVVDNASSSVVTGGTWLASTYVPGFYGSNYLYGSVADGSVSVAFTPSLPVAGTYKVYALWTGAWSARDKHVPFEINHKLGKTTTYVDETATGTLGQLLGTFSFNQGSTGSVVIRTAGTTGDVVADAVRFEQVADGTVLTPVDPITVTTYTLTVSKSGTGSGTVTGTGISCGTDCSETVNSGTSVTLTASAAIGSTFSGWSGACTGTGSCTVSMTAAKSVTATFDTTVQPPAVTYGATIPVPSSIDSTKQNFYVATTGNDANSGTLASPWKTISKALASVPAGSVINARAGVYNENLFIRDQAGTTVQSYPGERAVISAPSATNVVEVYWQSPNMTFRNLDIIGGQYYGFKIDGDGGNTGILVEGCRIHDTGSDAVKITPHSNNVTIRNNEIYNSGILDTGNADNANSQGIDSVNADYLLVSHNYIHNTLTEGAFSKGGSVGAVFEYNKVENVGLKFGHGGILLGQRGTGADFFDQDTNPNLYECINCSVRNNSVNNSGGAGVAIMGTQYSRVENNVLTNTTMSGTQAGIFLNSVENWNASGHLNIPNVSPVITGNKVSINSTRAVIEINGFDLDTGGPALSGTFTVDNNKYWSTVGTPSFWDIPKNFTGNFAGWQADTGGDKNSSVSQ